MSRRMKLFIEEDQKTGTVKVMRRAGESDRFVQAADLTPDEAIGAAARLLECALRVRYGHRGGVPWPQPLSDADELRAIANVINERSDDPESGTNWNTIIAKLREIAGRIE